MSEMPQTEQIKELDLKYWSYCKKKKKEEEEGENFKINISMLRFGSVSCLLNIYRLPL